MARKNAQAAAAAVSTDPVTTTPPADQKKNDAAIPPVAGEGTAGVKGPNPYVPGAAPAMKPSVGRIVHFQPKRDVQPGHDHESFAAVVTAVAKDGSVSLTVFAPNSTDRFHGVKFAAEPTPGFWTWPPRV